MNLSKELTKAKVLISIVIHEVEGTGKISPSLINKLKTFAEEEHGPEQSDGNWKAWERSGVKESIKRD